MIKKSFWFFCLLLLGAKSIQAAPYNMDAPIESYTWGEDVTTVWKSGKDSAGMHKVSNDLLLLIQQDDSALLFRFWHNQLVGISKSHSSRKITPAENTAIYTRYLEEFTARWGKPLLEQPSLTSPTTYSEVVWRPVAKTQVTLYQNTAKAERPFVGYSYTSREIQPKVEEEIRRYGAKRDPYSVLKTFKEKPEYAKKTLSGMRIQVEARIVTLSPLTLDKKGKEIVCTLKNRKDAKSLQAGQIITVSGVIAGAKDGSLLLSDTIFVQDHQIAINRKGKRPQGFFAIETFSQQLERAANQVEKDFSIREYISPVRQEGQRAVVDFVKNDMPAGLSFSLEPLYKDQSSDTLAFNMHIGKENEEKINGYLMLGVVSIVIKASQPDASMDEVWGKLDSRAMKEGKGEKTVVVNGWTYRINFSDDRNFTFSATAPKRHK